MKTLIKKLLFDLIVSLDFQQEVSTRYISTLSPSIRLLYDLKQFL